MSQDRLRFMKKINYLFMTLSLFCLIPSLQAQELKPVEVFYRCYSHIVGKRPVSTHSLISSVKKKAISPQEACLLVLEKAELQSDGRIKNSNNPDPEALSVINNFTKLHMSFFSNPSLGDSGARYNNSADIFDEQYPALTYTQALFKPDFYIDDILKGNEEFEGIRTNGRPARGIASNLTPEQFTTNKGSSYTPLNAPLVESGSVIGVRKARQVILPNSPASNKNLLSSYGGGLLGSMTYSKKNNPSIISGNPNGTNTMRRMWSQAVLKDFLCKDLPAVRLADGQPYSSPNADAIFRKSTGCIQCHATMDPLAGAARGFRRSQNSPDRSRFFYAFPFKADQPDASHWPLKADDIYYRRPAKGALYFRSYTGELINNKFKDFDSLAQSILQTDDYYACVAKKYYEHFTGISASLADIEDPFTNIKLNSEDMFHRESVIKIGEVLRETKDPLKAIEMIIKSPQYQHEGYTLIEGVN